MYNNYNTNANGPDIECYTGYDHDLSRMYFEENVEILQHSSYNQSCIAFFHGQELGADDIEWRLEGTVKELKRYVRDECYWLESGEIRAMRKAELLDSVMESLERDAHITLLNFEDMQDTYFTMSRHAERDKELLRRMGYELKDYKIKLVPTHNGKDITISSYETRGYCQGDYAKVWYIAGDYEPTHAYIDNLFWDSPIYARAEINGQEYHYYDMPGAETYEWNREAWIEYLVQESGVNKADIEPLVPEYPEC